MFKKYYLILIFLLLVSLSSCNTDSGGDGSSSSCNFKESINDGGGTFYTINSSKAVAQRFRLNSSIKLSRLTLDVTFLTSTEVTISIYKDEGGDPDSGELVGRSSGGKDNTTSQWYNDFKFSGLSLSSNTNYFIVMTTTSGTFRAESGVATLTNIFGEFWEYDGNNWRSISNHDTVIQMEGKYSCN